MGPVPRSGRAVTIESHGYRAQIATTGATLRELTFAGRPLIAGFAADSLRPAMRGAVLVPWPNRTEDGRFAFQGRSYQLTVDEPETRTAIHGLAAWAAFDVKISAPTHAVLEATLGARPGYPWQLRVSVGFGVDEHGLHQTVSVENQAGSPAPVGIGGHPYLVAGPSVDGAIDEWTLALDAERVLLSSPERLLPERLARVADQPTLDFRAPRALSGTEVNHCYTGLARHREGIAEATLRGRDGYGTRISWDHRCGWVQVYTADDSVEGTRRMAVAVEPMTCPPNALNSGTDLLTIPPGGCADAGWTIDAL